MKKHFAMRMNPIPGRAALTFAFVFFFSHACSGQEKITGTEKLLLDSVNRERAARQLPMLKWDEGLASAARKHAELMAEQSLLLHRLRSEADLATRARQAGVSFSRITENIGMAAYPGAFHDGWMHSPGHRANILDAAVDSIGIAVAEGGKQLFAVEDFARVVTLLSIEEQEKQIERLIAAHGLRILKLEITPGKVVSSTANMRRAVSLNTSRTTKRPTFRSCLRVWKKNFSPAAIRLLPWVRARRESRLACPLSHRRDALLMRRQET
jgi:hypothetical protein